MVISGFGNPLLDLTVQIKDDELLKKYEVEADDQKEISAQEMQGLIKDIVRLDPILTPGGCAQNTLRIIQWILQTPDSTVMYGAIGHDEQGETLKLLVETSGVQTRYIIHPNKPTGVSINLISDGRRALIAHIGAAEEVKVKDLKSDGFLSNTNLVYMEAFFLTTRVPVANYIQETCQKNKILFAFNLSAVYMANIFTVDVLHFAEKCDLLIGNFKEYTALIKALQLQDDIQSFASKLAKKYTNTYGLKYGKMCAVTHGSQPAFCIHGDGIIDKYETLIDPKDLVDTTGAGDAFAAGFICGVLEQKPPKECLKWGCETAKEIIQQIGCSIPKHKPTIRCSVVF